jgi:hypothetical protein
MLRKQRCLLEKLRQSLLFSYATFSPVKLTLPPLAIHSRPEMLLPQRLSCENVSLAMLRRLEMVIDR